MPSNVLYRNHSRPPHTSLQLTIPSDDESVLPMRCLSQSPSVPVLPPPKPNGPYPEDQEEINDETFIDSSLSVDEAVAWIADETPGTVANSWSGDKDRGADDFGHIEDSCCPTHFLEPFDSKSATSTWTRWDGTA